MLKTSTEFLWHFLRQGYPAELHSRDLALLWSQVKAFNVAREFTWMPILVSLTMAIVPVTFTPLSDFQASSG